MKLNYFIIIVFSFLFINCTSVRMHNPLEKYAKNFKNPENDIKTLESVYKNTESKNKSIEILEKHLFEHPKASNFSKGKIHSWIAKLYYDIGISQNDMYKFEGAYNSFNMSCRYYKSAIFYFHTFNKYKKLVLDVKENVCTLALKTKMFLKKLKSKKLTLNLK